MNRIYKVIFNRNRNLVQVVPEYAHSNGKEVSASRHDSADDCIPGLCG